MNKTISINLGGRNFFIEEDAYQKLEAYLNAIKARFAEYPGSAEIVADMESRIGEKFGEKYEAGSQAVIVSLDVDRLISELGSVEDIAGEEGVKNNNNNYNDKNNKDSFAPKRLMRNGDDKIIAGVASGLAAYFNIDPFIVRLVFGILFFAGGSIIPIYLLLWLIMPEAKTATEKMQMRGQALNLGSIGETIKERAQEFKEHVNSVKKNEEWKKWGADVKEKAAAMGGEMGQAGKRGGQGFGNFLRRVFAGLGLVILFIVKLFRRLISLVLILAFGVAVAAVTLAFATAIFNANSPYIGLPIASIPHTAAFYALLVLAYIIVIIPLMFLLLLAVSIFSARRSGLNAATSFSLFGLWMLALIVGAALGGRYVPQYINEIKNSPQLQVVSKVYDAKDFNKLDLANSINYKLVQGNNFSVKASGWAMDLDKLSVSVNNGTLNVRRGGNSPCIFCIIGRDTVEITAPDFAGISAGNSSAVFSNGLTATSTSLSLENSSHADIHYIVKDLTISLGNSSTAHLAGSADTLNAKLYNSSHLDSTGLLVKDADVTTENSSLASVNASGTLKYATYNSSQIYYTGNPQVSSDKPQGYFENPPIPQQPPMPPQ